MNKRSQLLCAATLVVGQFLPSLGWAEVSGSYLVARQADRANDFQIAADYYAESLFFDPTNTVFAQGAVDAYMALGDFASAAEISRDVLFGVQDTLGSNLALIVDAAIEQRYGEIIGLIESAELTTNELTDKLILAWSLIGDGRADEGVAVLEAITADTRFRAFGYYHLGLAKAFTGDFEGALQTYAEETERGFQSGRSIYVEARILAHLGRGLEAVRKLRSIPGSGDADALVARIDSGETVSLDMLDSAADGMAEVFYTLADALSSEGATRYNLIYAQVAAQIRPDDAEALLLVAEMLEGLDRPELARNVYLDISPDDAAFFNAALGVAETLRTEGQLDEAIAHLQGVLADIGEGPFLRVTLGDIYRQTRDYAAARQVYTQRLDNPPSPAGYQDWYIYYVRGITNERLGNWPAAEADFRKSLELQPAQAQVLNYLGYSLVEKRIKLDEALSMIEEAAALRPNNGYIVDSLGWVLYRLGRFDDAVEPMERAVELMPTDPIVTDHLGDVYWKVGRKREAQFQWQRALSFVDPDEDNPDIDPDRIRRKLEVGLDIVLDEEATDD